MLYYKVVFQLFQNIHLVINASHYNLFHRHLSFEILQIGKGREKITKKL